MAIFFIADLHLRQEEPGIYSGFLRFLRENELDIEALYILGDLFEVWIGDKDPNPLYHGVVVAIRKLVNSGIPCFFIHGNRDFLIGKRFARESGITLLPEEKVLILYGHRVLIMHGDTLCSDDISYQAFRTKVRTAWIKRLFLSLPMFMRIWIVSQIRSKGKGMKNTKPIGAMDVNLNMVIKKMKKHRVRWLIHGHTHCSDIHEIVTNGTRTFRIVLGAWSNIGSMIKVTPKGMELISFLL